MGKNSPVRSRRGVSTARTKRPGGNEQEGDEGCKQGRHQPVIDASRNALWTSFINWVKHASRAEFEAVFSERFGPSSYPSDREMVKELIGRYKARDLDCPVQPILVVTANNGSVLMLINVSTVAHTVGLGKLSLDRQELEEQPMQQSREGRVQGHTTLIRRIEIRGTRTVLQPLSAIVLSALDDDWISARRACEGTFELLVDMEVDDTTVAEMAHLKILPRQGVAPLLQRA